jgi:hypothetical protein
VAQSRTKQKSENVIAQEEDCCELCTLQRLACWLKYSDETEVGVRSPEFIKRDGVMWTGLVWLRIGTGRELL